MGGLLPVQYVPESYAGVEQTAERVNHCKQHLRVREGSTTSHLTDVASTHAEVSVAVRHTNACIPGQRTPPFGIPTLKTQELQQPLIHHC